MTQPDPTPAATDADTPPPSRLPQWLQFLPRPQAHWTPRYLMDRVGVAWTQFRHPEWPWLAPDTVRLLEQRLRPTDTFVEFGSGRSTLWFAQRVGRLISVEHHAEWHAKITGELADAGVNNVEYLLTPTDPEAFLGCAADALGDEPADVVLVDGPNRGRCALWALDRLRPGGLLLIDDAQRYLPIDTRVPTAKPRDQRLPSAEWQQFWERAQGYALHAGHDATRTTVAITLPA